MRNPDFLIVGAMKAGTTTLVKLLKKSEDIFIPNQELHYFDKHFNEPFDSYLKHFPKDRTVAGEKTATYSYDPDVPKRIFNVLPNIKLIWILRDPIERAYSNYWHAYKKGGELQSFEEVIRHDQKRYEKNIFKAYLKRSKYIEQIERFLNFFELDQMHFLLLEELKKNQSKELKKLSDFLDILPFKVESVPQTNKTYLPRSAKLEFWAKKYFGNSVFQKVIYRINKKSYAGYPKLSEDLRHELTAYFEPYNKELAKLTGLDLSCWGY